MSINDNNSKKLRVYLLRHGEVENASEMRVNGHKDVRLSRIGEEQMKRIAEELCKRPIKAIFSSDLYRSRRGAELLAQKLKLKANLLPELREMHFGEVEGLLWKDALARFGDKPAQWINWIDQRFPGGENLLDFRERVMPVYRKIILEESGEIAVFAHGGTNRIIICEELGIELKNFFILEQSYACVNIIDYYQPKAKLIRLINGDISSLCTVGGI